MDEKMKYAVPFILVLGVMLGIALVGTFVESIYGPIFGFQIPLVHETLGAILVGGLSLIGTQMIVDKWVMR